MLSWRCIYVSINRVYVSLTGERLDGKAAYCRQREDDLSQAMSARSDLKHMLQRSLTYGCGSGSTPEAPSLLSFGLPPSMCARYAAAHVRALFPWQLECLSVGKGSVWEGNRNLVYSAPTSGGKTLVAEILMLRRFAMLQQKWLETQNGGGSSHHRVGFGIILFVVPFVALANEKAVYFQRMWRDIQIGVQAYHGDDDGRFLFFLIRGTCC